MSKMEHTIKGKIVSEDLFNIILKRVEAMPSNIKLAVLGSVLTREDILREIKKSSQIGQELLEMEIDYYNDLLRD